MADYSEFMYRPPPEEWAKRYSVFKYNEVVCKFCGSIVHQSLEVRVHDDMHTMKEGMWINNAL